MKILICHRPGGAFGYISDAWINAFRSKGHEVQRWDGAAASWEQFGPDLHIGCSGHRQPIPTRHTAKIAIHVNPYGPVDLTGINESQDAINWTIRQRPHAVFGYGHEEDRLLWSYWTERHKIPWVPMPTAGDKCVYDMVSAEPQKIYDIVYVGGYWAYKAQNIDPYLLNVLRRPGITYKLHGWGDWPDTICSGAIADDQVAKFFHSGRVGACIAEPHTHRYGIDVPERMYKVILSGAMAIHDAVPGLKKYVPSIVVAQNPHDYSELCWYYSRPENAEERIRIVAQQRAEVLSSQTYHHRLSVLLQTLGFTSESQGMLC